MKLLVALQYHVTDQDAAVGLARLIADLVPESKCPYADFLFSASFQAEHDLATIRYVARKFDQVRTYRCIKNVNGWPQGPNNQAHETARHFAHMVHSGRWHYSGILLAEPDCVPLKRDWIKLLFDEWHAGTQNCLGPWVTYGPPPYQQHINGNAIFGPRFILSNSQIFRAPDWIGWDAHNAGFLMAEGRASKWIFSDYQHGTPGNPWRDCDWLFSDRPIFEPHPLWRHGPQSPAWLHGCKRWDLAQACVRERLL